MPPEFVACAIIVIVLTAIVICVAWPLPGDDYVVGLGDEDE